MSVSEEFIETSVSLKSKSLPNNSRIFFFHICGAIEKVDLMKYWKK